MSNLVSNNSQRTCVVTRKVLNKSDLLRINFGIIFKGRPEGRSVYIQKDKKYLEQAIQRNAISRGLKLGRDLTDEEVREVLSYGERVSKE